MGKGGGVSVTTDAKARKALPLCTGVLDYFPDALLAVAEVSRVGNEQHNPGEPLHWDKSKSTDEADALLRHLIDRSGKDSDGVRHAAKVAWRALALLQREIEAEREPKAVRELRRCVPSKEAEEAMRKAQDEHAAKRNVFHPSLLSKRDDVSDALDAGLGSGRTLD